MFSELLLRDHEDGLATGQPSRGTAGLVSVPERYVAGTDTRGRSEERPYPWSQQVIHEISGLGGSSFFQGTALISSNRKKAATNVFIVRAKIVSADQINRTGTMITPSNIRRMVMVFSFRFDISLYQLRCKVQGTGYRVQGITDKGEDRILTKQFYFERDCISRVNIPEILRHSF
jgi:hypothetical protein